MITNDLDALAHMHITDKKSEGHNYVQYYHALFEPLRWKPITVLEMGVAWGGSIRMWRDYFPYGTIIGVDLFKECPVDSARSAYNGQSLADLDAHLFQVDQQDPQLPELVAPWCPLNIVIDDCAHIPDKTLASFELLWPLVAPGGVYAIEDLGIHDLPYQDLLDKIRAHDDTTVELHNSEHCECYWWEIAIITKAGQ
jgi:cephalosporin hydroxylase